MFCNAAFYTFSHSCSAFSFFLFSISNRQNIYVLRMNTLINLISSNKKLGNLICFHTPNRLTVFVHTQCHIYYVHIVLLLLRSVYVCMLFGDDRDDIYEKTKAYKKN